VTELDELLSGTSASWVQGDRRLGQADIEAAIAADQRAKSALGDVSLMASDVRNDIAGLTGFRVAWRGGAVFVTAHTWTEQHRAAVVRLAEPPDAAVVLFTAGSSGTPKGVVHTHASLAYKTRQLVEVHGLTAADVVLMPAPLSHMSGLLNGLLVPGAAGMTTVLMERWRPDEALDLIERERVTFMVGPPTFFLDLMRAESFAPQKVASLRLISSGGAGVTEAFVNEASERLDCIVKRTYGSTEAPTVATTPVQLHGDPHRATTDGRATPGTELRVVDGELQVRGPELFWGYLEPAQTAEAMTEDGFYRTGDLATIDADGWLTITGRKSEVIIRGGENISPAQVVAVLEAHPAIEHATVIGVPDERLGEQVAAFVVLSPGQRHFDLDECRRWFAEAGAPRFTTPERLVLIDAMPRLPSGKPDGQALRARLGE
jgi:cyclohexanecarboxylate-CoA ligase